MLGQSSSLSPWAGPYVTDMLSKGAALADMPYQPYMGPLTAGASPLQQQAFQGLANLTVPSTITGSGFSPAAAYPTPPTYQPLAGGASFSDLEKQYEQGLTNRFGEYRGENSFQQPSFGGGLLFPAEGIKPGEEQLSPMQGEIPYYMRDDFGGMTPLQYAEDGGLGANVDQTAVQAAQQPQGMSTQQQLASLMNPYLELALQPQYAAAQRQADISAQNLQSQYGKAGAYGGSRQGVAEAELQRGLLDRMAGITGAGYSTAYDKAADLLGKERSYGLDVLREQQAGGATERAIESQGIAADIKQFEEERDYPYKQLQYQQSLLQGLPISTQSYQYAEPSTLSNVMGGAGGILGLLETMGVFGKKS